LAGAVGLYLLIGLVGWCKVRIAAAKLRGQTVPASENTFPEIHYIQNLVTSVLGYTRPTEVRVATTAALEPRWLFPGAPAVLLMPERLLAATIERADIGQLLWLLARMFGLMATRRQKNVLMRGLVFLARLNPLCWPFYNLYRRSTHFTADHLGLALGLSLIDAAEAMNKMMTDDLHGRMNFAQILQQAAAQRRSFFTFLDELFAARPTLVRRFENLVEFCSEKYPDLYADFELHRQYAGALLPSYREIQEFSEGKEEERRMLRELGKEVYELLSVTPPLNDADEISRAFLQLHDNRYAADQLEAKITRLQEAQTEWQNTVAKISAAEQKRENANRALESYYREIGRTAFTVLSATLPQSPVLQNIFEKAQQYQVVITHREHEIAKLEGAAGNVLDKSKHKVEVLALRAQNSTDAKRLQAAAEAVGEEFWRQCVEQFQHDDLEPIKLRITGVIAELERRRIELDNLFAQRRQIESKLEQEGLSATAKPGLDVPNFIAQLKNQARAAHALRPRLLETLGKSYWLREPNPLPETRGLVEQLHDLKRRIRAFELEENERA
ncbi:hypothetical protein HUU05_17040, partial [candidate division KSB1 bacterium]|nr:hypothetical protein [candidate division KSB1 bacterium]